MFAKRLPIIGILALATACQTPSAPPEELVAKVNGDGITKSAFEAAVERNMARYKGKGQKLPPGIEQRIQESVLRRLIDDKVVALKATELGISVTEQALTEKFGEHKARFRTDEAFQDYLRRSNNTAENMKKDLRRNMLRDQVVEKMSGSIEVGGEEVQKYYDDNLKRFIQKEQVKVSRILVRVAPKAEAAELKKGEADAKKIRAKAVKKGANFSAIARESSNGPEATRGGELGWLSRGRMPPEFDEVAFKLEPGQISEVVKTRLGYEIIMVSEKKAERQRPFEEVQKNIENSLTARKRNQKRREVLRELKSTAQVEQMLEFARPTPQKGPGMPQKLGMPAELKKPLPKGVIPPKAVPSAKPQSAQNGQPDSKANDATQ
ncbi:MAG: peptidylprolyl isomerase [Myxococcota bacterium]|nr:peptidylprolyl isomerase [Myxococcota bacterium]